MGNRTLFQLEQHAKDFFGFGEDPEPIHLVLPGFPNKRVPSLRCDNYPPYEEALTPDDVLSALTVHSLLSASYGARKVVLQYHHELSVAHSRNRILIGGPPTNSYVSGALDGLTIQFGGSEADRVIEGGTQPYRVEMNDDSTRIESDYCLITRRREGDTNTVVISGLRAYGQIASSMCLAELSFYQNQDVRRVSQNETFQVVVRVVVAGHVCSNWRVVDYSSPTDLFVCYNRKDKEEVDKFVAQLDARGLKVWVDRQKLDPGANWIDTIAREIRSARAVGVFLGKHRLEGFQEREYNLALTQSHGGRPHVFGVLLPTWPRGARATALPSFLNDRHCFDLATDDLNLLVTALRR